MTDNTPMTFARLIRGMTGDEPTRQAVLRAEQSLQDELAGRDGHGQNGTRSTHGEVEPKNGREGARSESTSGGSEHDWTRSLRNPVRPRKPRTNDAETLRSESVPSRPAESISRVSPFGGKGESDGEPGEFTTDGADGFGNLREFKDSFGREDAAGRVEPEMFEDALFEAPPEREHIDGYEAVEAQPERQKIKEDTCDLERAGTESQLDLPSASLPRISLDLAVGISPWLDHELDNRPVRSSSAVTETGDSQANMPGGAAEAVDAEYPADSEVGDRMDDDAADFLGDLESDFVEEMVADEADFERPEDTEVREVEEEVLRVDARLRRQREDSEESSEPVALPPAVVASMRDRAIESAESRAMLYVERGILSDAQFVESGGREVEEQVEQAAQMSDSTSRADIFAPDAMRAATEVSQTLPLPTPVEEPAQPTPSFDAERELFTKVFQLAGPVRAGIYVERGVFGASLVLEAGDATREWLEYRPGPKFDARSEGSADEQAAVVEPVALLTTEVDEAVADVQEDPVALLSSEVQGAVGLPGGTYLLRDAPSGWQERIAAGALDADSVADPVEPGDLEVAADASESEMVVGSPDARDEEIVDAEDAVETSSPVAVEEDADDAVEASAAAVEEDADDAVEASAAAVEEDAEDAVEARPAAVEEEAEDAVEASPTAVDEDNQEETSAEDERQVSAGQGRNHAESQSEESRYEDPSARPTPAVGLQAVATSGYELVAIDFEQQHDEDEEDEEPAQEEAERAEPEETDASQGLELPKPRALESRPESHSKSLLESLATSLPRPGQSESSVETSAADSESSPFLAAVDFDEVASESLSAAERREPASQNEPIETGETAEDEDIIDGELEEDTAGLAETTAQYGNAASALLEPSDERPEDSVTTEPRDAQGPKEPAEESDEDPGERRKSFSGALSSLAKSSAKPKNSSSGGRWFDEPAKPTPEAQILNSAHLYAPNSEETGSSGVVGGEGRIDKKVDSTVSQASQARSGNASDWSRPSGLIRHNSGKKSSWKRVPTKYKENATEAEVEDAERDHVASSSDSSVSDASADWYDSSAGSGWGSSTNPGMRSAMTRKVDYDDMAKGKDHQQTLRVPVLSNFDGFGKDAEQSSEMVQSQNEILQLYRDFLVSLRRCGLSSNSPNFRAFARRVSVQRERARERYGAGSLKMNIKMSDGKPVIVIRPKR